MHSTLWLEYPGLWVASNALTGLAYLAIAFVLRRWSGFVRAEYCWLFSAFIGACGLHHLAMTLTPGMVESHALHLLQGVIDTVMMAVSILTAGLVAMDAWRSRQTRA